MENYGKILVLAGGPSSEREISIKSGRAVYGALARSGQDVELFEIDSGLSENFGKKGADIAFIALHGRFGEDGGIQKILEDAGIAYTGSGVESSGLALDKIASREIFASNGIIVPRYMVVTDKTKTREILSSFDVPFVVKPRKEGSSIGLTVVKDPGKLSEALPLALNYDDRALVEEYIEGRELTVGIIGDETLPVIEIIARDAVYDYGAKYTQSDTKYIVPAELDKSIEAKARQGALKAHTLLKCRDFSRVDMRMDAGGNIFVLEVNTIPGMTERSLLPKAAMANGISFEKLCLKLVGMAYKRRFKEKGENGDGKSKDK
ncbi:MAG: D-alanine--D-alanine ligase [Candidatus Omnitrophica bacterium]|nr:D-alanine--D-alanine ligase [Candidatus Omnitrophota bacterium]